MKLISIVGMPGSGKSELASLFQEEGYRKIRFGDITDDILNKQGLEINEENEKRVREGLRKKHGMEAYAKANLEKIRDSLKESNVIIDGMYSWEEYLFLKERFPEMIVLAVYSPPETRYERLIDRRVRPITREQAVERDKKEIENLNKAPPIAMADYTIFNVGTFHDLEENLDKFFEWMREEDEAKLG